MSHFRRSPVLLDGQQISFCLKAFPSSNYSSGSSISCRLRRPICQCTNGSRRLIRHQHSQATTKPKCYVLSMFPYPSGKLHMGHLRVYTISDVLSRYKRMTGHDVLHPMGWDAFGLPAENAALERGVHPGAWTMANIDKMKEQLTSMGGQFDWNKEILTCSPLFYKHTQRIFLMLYERGLAYQAEAMVNYDPVDKTVLANEQVDANGNSWRSGAKVEKIMLKQWFLKITAFQETLLEGIESLLKKGTWPERVLVQQKHWLGKSEGAKIRFPIEGDSAGIDTVEVFTTRPDTLFGVQFIALSLNHAIVGNLAQKDPALKAFIEAASNLAPESKAGYQLSDVYAYNLVMEGDGIGSSGKRTRLPVFVAPYVLSEYGEGAVMGVPGHDSRDWAFWTQQDQKQRPKMVVAPSNKASEDQMNLEAAYPQHGVLTVACGKYAGLTSVDGGRAIVKDLQDSGQADFAENWRLRDWLISRQRYWGTPIPIIHCDNCGAVPVPTDQLPVELPDLAELPPGTTGNPLQHISSWVNTTCPKCDGPAKRDTDTMDTFVDSSWYYMRYPDSTNPTEPFSLISAQQNLPVDIYVGGDEHAILHLLYARFIHKFLVSEGLIPRTSPTTSDEGAIEPFKTVISQGMVHGRTFSDPATGRFLQPSEVSTSADGAPIIRSTGIKPNVSWEKMSKSKHNGVDPSTCIAKYGADATRAHMLVSAPVREVLEWDEEKIVGIQRWFSRIERLVADLSSSSHPNSSTSTPLDLFTLNLNLISAAEEDITLLLTLDSTIISVTRTFESNPYALNTTISDLIKLTNTLITTPNPPSSTTPSHQIHLTALSILLQLLSPIAPSFAQTQWTKLVDPRVQNPKIAETPFPTPLLTLQAQEALQARKKRFTCAVQVNGKLRFTATIPVVPTLQSQVETEVENESGEEKKSRDEEWILDRLLETEEGAYWLRERFDVVGRRKRMVVVRGGRVVNFVV